MARCIIDVKPTIVADHTRGLQATEIPTQRIQKTSSLRELNWKYQESISRNVKAQRQAQATAALEHRYRFRTAVPDILSCNPGVAHHLVCKAILFLEMCMPGPRQIYQPSKGPALRLLMPTCERLAQRIGSSVKHIPDRSSSVRAMPIEDSSVEYHSLRRSTARRNSAKEMPVTCSVMEALP